MARILVVEDEPELRELIVEYMDDEGHQTVEACNGQEGLDRLAEMVPDIILSDITMPIMNGYQFFLALKENHPEHGQTPFIFLTALSDREDELKGLRMGVDAYITKPIDFDILLARVDGLLRIFGQQKDLDARKCSPEQDPLPERQAQAEPSTRVEVDQEAIDKMNSIIERDNGKVIAGKFQTISLEKVRQRVGDHWQKISDKIMRNAEQVVRQHIGANDVVQITPAKDFTICFADLTADQAVSKVDLICKKIWERLFGETGDADLSSVEGSVHELALNANVQNSKEDIFSEVEVQISQEKQKLTAASQKRIEQIFTYEDMTLIKLLSGEGLPSKIDKLSFKKDLSDKVKTAFSTKGFNRKSLMNFQKLFFSNLQQRIGDLSLLSKSAVIISTDFSIIADESARKSYASYCKALAKLMEGVLIIEVTGTPDRFLSQIDALQPLPVGRRHQVIELRTPEQVSDLDWKLLHCAIVSMTYDDAMQHARDGLNDVIKEIRRHRIKFYIKEIPDGSLNDAQMMGADLYSMQK